ncbi:MAG: hypothetical protein AB7S26_33575 [Sandaracinaceae bacterium]
MPTRALALSLALFAHLPALAHADDASSEAAPRERRYSERERDSIRHAWGTFFGQAGAIGGGAIAAAVLSAHPDFEPQEDEISLFLVPVVMGAAGSAMGYLAEEGRWDANLGWFLSGVYPGALFGASVALGAIGLSDDAPELANIVDALLGAAALGGLLGAFGTWLEAEVGGHPGGLIASIYAGFGTGLAAGMLASTLDDSPEALAAPWLAAGVGALLGLMVNEVIRLTTE